MRKVTETHYIGEVIETEDGELAVELPIDMLNKLGWNEHTLLEWIVEEELQRIILKEAE